MNWKNEKWYKSISTCLIIIIALGLLIGLPFFLNWIVDINQIPSAMSEDTWLSFWGSYIGAIGTILLGAFALIQNQRYKNMADRYNEYIEYLSVAPEIYIEGIESDASYANDNKKINSINPSERVKTYYSNLKTLNFPVIDIEVCELKINNIAYKDFATNFDQTIFEKFDSFTQEIEIPLKYSSVNISIELTFAYYSSYKIKYTKTIKAERKADHIAIKIIEIDKVRRVDNK